MTDEQLKLLIEKMTEQSIPKHWQAMVASAMNTQARFMKMMNWLEENKNVDYESMDLVKAVNRIEDETSIIH